MIYLALTKKALRTLDLHRQALDPPGEGHSRLGNWIVNVVPMGDREAFIFMSTRCLLNFPMLIGARTPGPADMLAFLEHGVSRLAQEIEASAVARKSLIADFAEVNLSSSSNKSDIGVLSAIANEYHQKILLAGGVRKADMDQIVKAANSTPRATLEWRTSFEASAELLAASGA